MISVVKLGDKSWRAFYSDTSTLSGEPYVLHCVVDLKDNSILYYSSDLRLSAAGVSFNGMRQLAQVAQTWFCEEAYAVFQELMAFVPEDWFHHGERDEVVKYMQARMAERI